jgi:hypothetical protein
MRARVLRHGKFGSPMSLMGQTSVIRRCRLNVRFARKRPCGGHRWPARKCLAFICRVRLTGRYGILAAQALPLHAGLMLAARITLPHFSVSSAMNLPKSAGEPGSGVPRKVGEARIDLILQLVAGGQDCLLPELGMARINRATCSGSSIWTKCRAPGIRNSSDPGRNSWNVWATP